MKLIKKIIFLVLIFDHIYAAPSQTYNWKSVIIGGGGFVTGIIYHPLEEGLIYVRTDMGGAYRWDKTQGKWIPLTDMMHRNNSDYMGILSIAIDPTDTNRVYMMTGKYTASWAGNGAVLISNNRGTSWTIVPLNFKVGGNEDGRGCGERLVVDPNLPSKLLMGSGGNTGYGLWQSTNYGTSWTQISSFNTSANINFVIFDKSSGTPGNPTQRIFVGVRNTSGQSLYMSTNGGANWSVVNGQPNGLMAIRADIGGGYLYTTWANSPGPNGATAGAVWKYNISTGQWINITPANGSYGYSGISVNPQNPNHILVTTLNLWWPMDQIWQSFNGGSSWNYLLWNPSNNQVIANFDRTFAPWTVIRNPHWLADIKIDPFNSNKAMFVTGYGIWACDNINASPTTWYFNDNNLEELVPMEIISPPSGPLILSANGDQGVFKHSNLDISPPEGVALNCGTSLAIDYAENLPSKIVVAFNSSPYGAYSTNGGVSWTNFASYPSGATAGGDRSIAISANGNIIVWAPDNAPLSYSTNNGNSWITCGGGAPSGFWPEADKVNSNKFYYYDPVNGKLWISTNGGVSFSQASYSFPTLPSWLSVNGSVNAVFGREGDIWITCGSGGLYHSTDSGLNFTKISTVTEAYLIGFGKEKDSYPAIYLHGVVDGVLGIFRSDDMATTWVRINDDNHQFGWLHCIRGDRRTYGRCYISAEGRGIIYGDIALTLTMTPTQTNTITHTITRTPTFTITNTFTRTITYTFTNTTTNSFTQTATTTNTQTFTMTPTLTSTGTNTQTATFTGTRTFTSTLIQTNTNTPTNTFTFSYTTTLTQTFTYTNTVTRTSTNTVSTTMTNTLTFTFTATHTYTHTHTYSTTIIVTPTFTLSFTHTLTSLNTFTQTVTVTNSFSTTFTSTDTTTETHSPTQTLTYTQTLTHTHTATNTFTNSILPTNTSTTTNSITATNSQVPTNTNTFTLTNTPTFSWTNTKTSTQTPTNSQQPSASFTPTFTMTIEQEEVINDIKIYPQPFNLKRDTELKIKFKTKVNNIENIKVNLYTVAFRKIAYKEIKVNIGPGEIEIYLSKNQLKEFSNGIYYFTLEVYLKDERKFNTQINKLVVLR